MALFLPEAKKGLEGTGSEFALLLLAVFVCNLPFYFLIASWEKLWKVPEVTALAVLPQPDIERFSERRLAMEFITTGLFAGTLICGAYGFYAWCHQFTIAEWVIAVLLLILQVAATSAP